MISAMVISLYQWLSSTWTAVLVGVLGVLYLYGRWEDGYFRRRGVQSLPTRIPFLGNMMSVVLQREHVGDFTKRTYSAFPKERYIGLRQFTKPVVMITDLELIKQITIKDFDHFQDHQQGIDDKQDPLFGNSLGALSGQKWRDMKATLSPAFTSSKMRGMFEFVVECGEEVAAHFEAEMQKPLNSERGFVEVEMKDVFTRFTNDVIASTAFGLKVNSLKERKNEFYTMGKMATTFTGTNLLKLYLIMFVPKIAKAFDVRIFSSKVASFFRSLVTDTMDLREKHNILRPDMIQLLMQAKKGSLKHDDNREEAKETGFATVEESSLGNAMIKKKWTDDEITAQAALFFLAGFETSSGVLSFVAHELAANPDVQRKLQGEVDGVAAKNNGKLTYNDLLGMKYMDMVISETLRLWPIGVALDRKCVKTYTLPPPNPTSEKGLTLNINDGLWIPMYAIHHDPKYYKNPEKFDPERFSEENKDSINPLAYLPFGIGPRNCIASRFALMECKAIVFQLLQKFDLVVTTKTHIPMKIKTSAFNFTPDKGFWIGVKPRSKLNNLA